MTGGDNLPEPNSDAYDDPAEPVDAYVNGYEVGVEDLPMGCGHSPDWWDDDGFGEPFEEYTEHTD